VVAELTPAPTRTALLASRRRRLAAMLYELLLLIGVVGGGLLLPWAIIGMATGWAPAGWLLWLHLFFLLGGYFVWHWRAKGGTLAMKTWKLRLVTATGHPVGTRQAVVRYLLAWPSVATGVGLLWSLVDPDGQFLHDRLAGTRIIFWDWAQR